MRQQESKLQNRRSTTTKQPLKVLQLHMDTSTLVRAAAKQDEHARKAIYNSMAPKMLAVCQRYISDIHFAEDVMVTAFVKVFEKINSFEFKGSFEGWVRRVMVNECLSFLRKKREMTFEIQGDVAEETEDEGGLPEGLQPGDLFEMVASLPVQSRTVFNLFVMEDYSHIQISDALGISEGTSKSQLAYARKKLRQMVLDKISEKNGTVRY
ncbi:MAG: sigma-70 family RNA polymerase sigma factor [Saprospiraceae bacterium]|nr:sigma-70 family RNA polymerase sigma factor [Saprospiraceae bacterium]